MLKKPSEVGVSVCHSPTSASQAMLLLAILSQICPQQTTIIPPLSLSVDAFPFMCNDLPTFVQKTSTLVSNSKISHWALTVGPEELEILGAETQCQGLPAEAGWWLCSLQSLSN